MPLATTFGAIFFRQVSTINPYSALLIRRCTSFTSNIASVFYMDYVPRRAFTMVTLGLSAATFFTMGSLSSVPNPTIDVRRGILACAMIFPILRNAGAFPLLRVLTAEVPHLELREKTMAAFQLLTQVWDFLITFTLPYMLDKISGRVGFVFGSFTAVSVVWMYFWVPDLKRRSLEEIDEMFREKVPARKTQSKNSFSLLSSYILGPRGP